MNALLSAEALTPELEWIDLHLINTCVSFQKKKRTPVLNKECHLASDLNLLSKLILSYCNVYLSIFYRMLLTNMTCLSMISSKF